MTWLDIALLVICVASLIRGFKTGFVLQLTSLVGIVLGAIFAGKIAEKIYPPLSGVLENSEYVAFVLSYVIGFVVILLAVTLIGRIVNSIVNIALLSVINRVFGAAFCLGKWLLIISILINLLVIFDRDQTILKKDIREKSRFYPSILSIAQAVIPYLDIESFIPSGEEIQDQESDFTPQEVIV